MKFLIVGLGNIGGEYNGTRHNIGFDVVDTLAIKHDASWSVDKLGSICKVKHKGRNLILLKPSTFMNLSGKAVHYWMQKEKIPTERILIVTDDIAFPIETQKLKKNGSAGGHNGLKSIEECLKTQQYPRLRFGVGNDFSRGRQVDYVLGKWDDKEIPLLQKKVLQSIEIIENFVTIGLGRTMNAYNNKKVSLLVQEEKPKPQKENISKENQQE